MAIYFRKSIGLFLKILKSVCKWILGISGGLAILMVILSFTSLPFWGYYWLGTSVGSEEIIPDYIIVLGGSPMPGESSLIRTYYGTVAANRFPGSKVFISLPGDVTDEESSVNLMKKELEIRNVDTNRILIENQGTNTRFQALEIKKLVPEPHAALLIITSPEHVRRAVLAFRKAGFVNTAGMPAFGRATDFDLLYNDAALGGNNKYLPEIGGNIQLRYRIWRHLECEILIIRECLALGFYFLKGWI
ncbi:MAG: YdcF family protein [Bacteroidetes bacterium]|nr:YdcF family protein [Bacteroidota bacterium]